MAQLKLSVVIASYNDPEGLYLSFWSVYTQLRDLLVGGINVDFEIIVAADGGTPVKWENVDRARVRVLRLAGSNRTGSPQGTRDAGIRAATYPVVLCIESHVIVGDLAAWYRQHLKTGAAISFPRRVGESLEQRTAYGASFDWNVSFWNKTLQSEPKSLEPYKICQCGHSAFMLDRDWYLQSGGYTLLQQGYGGEEPWLNLKVWMLGRESWMIPLAWHAHYMDDRGNGAAISTVNFAFNFKLAAYVMGGKKYLDLVGRSFADPSLRITPDISIERARICAGPFGGDLDKLRELFLTDEVVN